MTDPTPSTVQLPEVSEGQVGADLRWLTEQLMTRGAPTTGGLLGGEFGYGAEFDNDVFEMHPYFWGDCECGFDEADTLWCQTHDHAADCYQQVIRAGGFVDHDTPTTLSYAEKEEHNRAVVVAVCAEMGLDADCGSYVHCTCSYTRDYAVWRQEHDHDPACGVARPNFRHKGSGTRVDWYKYIGRGMEIDVRADWRTVLAECVASLEPDTTP